MAKGRHRYRPDTSELANPQHAEPTMHPHPTRESNPTPNRERDRYRTPPSCHLPAIEDALWEPGLVRADITAAIEVAEAFDVVSTDPMLLQETNNTVVWLRPHAVVAKVATRLDARNDLRLEHAIARELVAVGGEIAAPLPATEPVAHEETGFVVTLWERLDGFDRAPVTASDLFQSLGRLHDALAETTTPAAFLSFLIDARSKSSRRRLVDDRSAAGRQGVSAAMPLTRGCPS